MQNLARALSAASFFLVCNQSLGQDIPDLTGPFGNLVVPEVDLFEIPYPEDTGRPDVRWTIKPTLTYADGTDIAGATFGSEFGIGNLNRFNVEGQYLNVSPDNSPNLDQWRWRGKYNFALSSPLYQAAIVAEHKSLENVFDQTKLDFSLSRRFADRYKFVANLGWVDKEFDAGGGEEDFAAAVGLWSQLDAGLALGLDYSFKNDVSGESYSVTAVINGTWIVGAAKDDVYYAVYSISF